MPFRLGTTELVIILVIIVLLFGVGRIGKIAGELGSSIKAFRKSMSADDEEEKDEDEKKEEKVASDEDFKKEK